jgi:hypothetical protein
MRESIGRRDLTMQSLADYDVILDKFISLGAGAGQDADVDFDINVPNILPEVRSVLSWVIDPGTAGVSYEMTIKNGSNTALGPFTASASDAHSRQEVVDANVLTPTGNVLKINVTSGNARFSDIVLMYQASDL